MNKKIILVTDSKIAKFYKVIGLKIKELIATYTAEEFNIPHKKQSLRTGFQKGHASGGAHFFDPHSEAKNLDRKQFCKKIVELLSKELSRDTFSELIVIAEPKSLGDLRYYLNGKFKHIEQREISKDLTHAKENEIETAALSHL